MGREKEENDKQGYATYKSHRNINHNVDDKINGSEEQMKMGKTVMSSEVKQQWSKLFYHPSYEDMMRKTRKERRKERLNNLVMID